MALQIKPSQKLIDFLNTLPKEVEIPPNIVEVRKSEEGATINNSDLRWISNYIRKVNRDRG